MNTDNVSLKYAIVYLAVGYRIVDDGEQFQLAETRREGTAYEAINYIQTIHTYKEILRL